MQSQSQDKHTVLLERLAQQAETLQQSEGWKRWLATASRFHHRYSLQNQLLILSQKPDATRVAGFRTWQSLGRSVRKGEKGIAIFAPRIRHKVDESGDEKRVLTGFGIAHVFDVSQTDGEALPDIELPEVIVPTPDVFDRLVDVAEACGYTVVTFTGTSATARGWFRPDTGTITIVDRYSIASKTRTLLHELAHAHDPLVYEVIFDRRERELVAESAAYIVGTRLGIDMNDASTVYVTSWGASTERLQALASEVLDVARGLEEATVPVPELTQ